MIYWYSVNLRLHKAIEKSKPFLSRFLDSVLIQFILSSHEVHCLDAQQNSGYSASIKPVLLLF